LRRITFSNGRPRCTMHVSSVRVSASMKG
jgi:hypothetical protein